MTQCIDIAEKAFELSMVSGMPHQWYHGGRRFEKYDPELDKP